MPPKNSKATKTAVRKLHRPKLAVWKFSSCDGCQLSLLDCEDELLAITEHIEIANFLEASRAVVKGPYDISLVEGSITTPHDAERIHQVRRQSKFLITIGACATAGGIQACGPSGSMKPDPFGARSRSSGRGFPSATEEG